MARQGSPQPGAGYRHERPVASRRVGAPASDSRTSTTSIRSTAWPLSECAEESAVRDVKRWGPMGDLEIRVCRDADGHQIVSRLCSRWSKCNTERVALSVKYNSPMTNEAICRTWPGAHLGVVRDEEPRWILKPHRAGDCCEPVEVA
jgi:hypothetical protein